MGLEEKVDKFRKEVPLEAGVFKAPDQSVVVQSESESGRFTLIPYSGQQFDHWFWGKLAFDIDGISMRKQVIPAFKDHDASQLVGEIDSIEKDQKSLRLSGDFAETFAANTIKAAKKLEWESSLAFDLGSAEIQEVSESETAEVNGETFQGPGHIVRKASLYETSFTAFGAVPGTGVKFNKDQSTHVNIYREENQMGEITQEDIEQSTRLARDATLDIFKKMNELSDDAAFVGECYSKGMSLEEFQSELLQKLKTENTQLKEQISKLELAQQSQVNTEFQNGVSFSAEAESAPEEKLDFVALANKIKTEQNISLGEAFSKVASQHPALYEEYVSSCPVSKSR